MKSQLTMAERRVGSLLVCGLEQREIARRLVVSRRTVYTHVRNVKLKTGSGCTTAALRERLRLMGCR